MRVLAASPARRLAVLLGLALSLAAATASRAQTWTEVGDAGDLPINAQSTAGLGGLLTLSGTLSSAADVDMYCIQTSNMVDVPGYPVLTLTCWSDVSPNVWVFDANGMGISTNESCAGGFKTLTTTTLYPFTAYYVAVSYSGVAAVSTDGPMWLAATGERSPDGPGAASAVTGWAGSALVTGPNPYQLGFNFTGYCESPTPAVRQGWGSLKIRYGN
uniref:Uncharacterized protein n=1 Tax=Eiseniibacteriota bacterium TaxID=2212470 RepID=A0A832I479_UNCEI